MRRILITGKDGQIGWELQRSLASLGEVTATDRRTLDISDPAVIRRVIREIRPQIIVNAAAYTAVDQAESDAATAMAVNGVAPGIMAEEARRLGAVLIHYSTDYVFDGARQTPYTEEDAPHPLNEYGSSKLAGERAIQDVGGAYLILRTGWVYGWRGRNFLRTILKLAAEKDELRIVDDQTGSPTWSRAIAELTGQIVARRVDRADAAERLGECAGIYHITAKGETSWYGFAKRIMEKTEGVTGRRMTRLSAIVTSEYPVAAKRPAYSVLSNRKLVQTFGLELPSWETMIDLCLSDMGHMTSAP